MKKLDNKIKIPWYKRTINVNNIEGNNIERLNLGKIRYPEPTKPEQVREAVPESVPQVEKVPYKVPYKRPMQIPQKVPFLNPIPSYPWEWESEKEPEPEPSFAFSIKSLFEIENKELVEKYNLSEPIFMNNNILERILKEAERNNLDIAPLLDYFSTYDWDNYNQYTLYNGMVSIVGVIGATKLIKYFLHGY